MKFLLDENLSLQPVIRALAQQGHDVVTVRAVGLSGCSDEEIREWAQSEGATLVMLSYRRADGETRVDNGLVVVSPFPGQTLENIVARLIERFRPFPLY